MRSKLFFRIVALLALAALASPAFARPIARKISLQSPAKFGKSEIQAGEYRLIVDGDRATLMQGSRVVGQMRATWEERPETQLNNSFLINRFHQIEEVRFAGDNRVLVLSSQ